MSLDWGYRGVFVLMAIESTVFPLPSELVVPPAAYWARQGHLNFWGVVIAATLGSWAGSSISYLVARRLGRPLMLQYGLGVGLPVNGTVMVNSSPAITVMSRMLRSLVILGAPEGQTLAVSKEKDTRVNTYKLMQNVACDILF